MSEEIIGLIPAAGIGSRLGLPYPKELFPIVNGRKYKPVSQFILENIIKGGVSHIVFVINETKHQLMRYYGDGHRFNCELSYVVQEQKSETCSSTSPGLAHALNAGQHLIKNKIVFFGMADTIIFPKDVFRRLFFEMKPEDDVVCGLFPTHQPHKYGMVRLDESQLFQEVIDKPKKTELRLMWGCMIWRTEFSEFLNICIKNGDNDFATILNKGIKNGIRIRGISFLRGKYFDLGTYEDIFEIRKMRVAA